MGHGGILWEIRTFKIGKGCPCPESGTCSEDLELWQRADPRISVEVPRHEANLKNKQTGGQDVCESVPSRSTYELWGFQLGNSKSHTKLHDNETTVTPRDAKAAAETGRMCPVQ